MTFGEVYTSLAQVCLERTESSMKKSLILALVAVVFACVARASEVSPEMASQAASAWSTRNAAFGVSAADVGTAEHFADTNGVTLWYQVQMGTSCLIVSPVTELEPVIAVLENVDATEGLPAGHPMLTMLTRDMTDRLKKLGLYRPRPPAGGMTLMGAAPVSDAAPEDPEFAAAWAKEGEARWAQLLPKGGARLMAARTDGITAIDVQIGIVDGFEKGGRFTHWNQGNAGGGLCYNYYTPNHAVCGCTATSMGALMQFFAVTGCVAGATCPDDLVRETQDHVKGAVYVDAAGNVTTGFTTLGGDYDWSLFSDNKDRASYNTLTEEQRKLLGRVAYDAGVAIATEWTDGETSGYVLDAAVALRKVFGFKDARGVFNPTEEQYAKLIYHQCWAGAPVQLGIQGSGGHSVLAVGYGKDAGGIPRVRIFTGWGGSGDAWYALPYITTASVPGGGNHNFDVIQQVVTLIGYDDDKVIPVCGRIIPANNATVECCGETVAANGYGYFGLRISAAEAAGVKPVSVAVDGDAMLGSVELGTAVASEAEGKYGYDAADLCSWIPDDVLITRLNSETASTFAEAKAKALASIDTGNPKAILAFSGTWGTNFTASCELATAAAWEYLKSLDEANTDDFTNKYVVLCTPYGTWVSDGNPSFAVFDPRALMLEPNKLWSFYNGRLSYWTIGGAVCTEDAALVASARTNVVQNGSLPMYVTPQDVVNGLISVLEDGRAAFLASVSGVTLDVVGFNVASTTNDTPGAVVPAYGSHTNTISAGEVFTATAPAIATNAEGKVEFTCKGWRLPSTNSDEVASGTGTTATFTPVPNGAYTLTWLWEPKAVKIDVQVINNASYGTVSPGTGWFPYGQRATFIATPREPKLNTYYRFGPDEVPDTADGWVLGDIQDGDDFERWYQVLRFTVVRPVTVKAFFTTASEPQVLPDPSEMPDPPDPPDPPSPEDPVTNVFNIVWNAELNNLSEGYSTNLLTSSALSEKGWTTGDITVNAPTGWVATVSNKSGIIVATLSRDDAALEAAMETCSLTVIPNDDETLTVKATVSGGLRGFWYVLYGSDDLATWEAVTTGTYEKGTPAAQAQGTAKKPVDKVELSIIVTPGDSAAGTKRFYKVVSGATSEPLAE